MIAAVLIASAACVPAGCESDPYHENLDAAADERLIDSLAREGA